MVEAPSKCGVLDKLFLCAMHFEAKRSQHVLETFEWAWRGRFRRCACEGIGDFFHQIHATWPHEHLRAVAVKRIWIHAESLTMLQLICVQFSTELGFHLFSARK